MTAPPWRGGAGSTRARCVLAPNPGPMTLDGTNTWVLREPGSARTVVVDPGPLDDGHLSAVARLARAEDGRADAVLLTHGHLDHAEGAVELARRLGVPVLAPGPGGRLHDGQVMDIGGLTVEVVATPGHTSDSVSFLVPADAALLTGDTVLGRGTTVVAWPDGALASYLESLELIAARTGDGTVATILPGHGPVVGDPAAWLRFYLDHRHERLAQVRQAVADGAADARAVVETVYAEVPRELWDAAELSVRAQLEYLGA